jgi:pimeloyl-ACP methyl ester carboxylesterase
MFLNLLPWLPERLLSANDHSYLLAALRSWPVHKQNFARQDLDVYPRQRRAAGALTAMLNYYRAMFYAPLVYYRRGQRKVRAPTLMIWGERDRALGQRADRWHRAVRRSLSVGLIPGRLALGAARHSDKVNALLEHC